MGAAERRARGGGLVVLVSRVSLVALLAPCAPSLAGGESPLRFRDVAGEVGLREHLAGAMAHAAAWGDVDGDGRLDLFVGTFADRPAADYRAGGAAGPVPNRLLLFRDGRFVLSPDPSTRWFGRASGAVFADLDSDGRLDLYVANNGRLGHRNLLYHQRGAGRLVDVTDRAGAPVHLPETARSATVLDHDGDGILDLLVLATVGKGATMLFRGRSGGDAEGLRFERTDAIPPDAMGLGVAVGDLTGNGWPDVVIGGPNRVFVQRGGGAYREAHEAGLRVEFTREDDSVSCGVALGDFDRDGRQDILLGTHPKAPWRAPRALRLFRNLGSSPDRVRFEEVTDAGIVPCPMRMPHVEMRDFDNDGWPDLYSGVVVHAAGRTHPVIFRNLGRARGGRPRFQETAFVHRPEFPGPDDLVPGERSAAFYERLVRQRRVMYFAPGPSADYDGDGRLDLFLASWFPRYPSLLLRNETPAGRYLDVEVVGRGRLNPMGVGSMVRAYRVGQRGRPEALLASEEIATGYGYCSGQPPIAHLGLGDAAECDLEVTLPHGGGRIVRDRVPADRRIRLEASR